MDTMVDSGSDAGSGALLRGLTDDVLTEAPRARSLPDYFREAVDRLVGADPGLVQLRTALQAVLGIAAGVGLGYLFVKVTGELQLPSTAGPAALVAAHNRALLIVAMLLSGMIAMMAGFVVTDATARAQALSTLFLPVPMVAAMSIGLALGPYRVPSLIWLVVLLSLAVYVRRFGPRGFSAGLVAFNGGFLGFFLHSQIDIGDIGWLAADLGVGALASLVVRFVFFRPNLVRTLARMRRSWESRSRRMLTLAIRVLETEDEEAHERAAARIRRQAVRLNESTLMIDAQLVQSVPASAEIEAQRLFDAELALSNIARFATGLSIVRADAALRARAREALAAALGADEDDAAARIGGLLRARAGDVRTTVLVHRLATSLEDYMTARRKLYAVIADRDDGLVTHFTPAVELASGFLPGSVTVSTEASTTPGRGGFFDRSTMPPYVRSTIQIAVAASLAVVVGDLVSGPRLYWAMLATFLAFMATTNSGEQIRKALFRVAGTAIGVVVGDLLVRVTGGNTWISLVIVMVALFFGIYLIRINYTFMVIGITVTMSQLYVQLGEFSWNLLLLRLGETAIGVGAVVITVLVIVPLRPQRVLTAGVLLWFRDLSTLVDQALERLLGTTTRSLRPAVRQLDAAYAALEATAEPLRRSTFGRNSAQLSEIRAISAAVRSYARSLAVGAEEAALPDTADLSAAAEQLRESMAAIEHRIETGEHGGYLRSAALVALVAEGLPAGETPEQLALRDLTVLDGALARLAAALQMDVLDYETAPSAVGSS